MSGKIVNYYDGPTECVGYLSIPESSNLVPLVLVAHTWKGRSDFEDQKVLALNDLGYAAPVSYTHLTLPTSVTV